MIEQICLISLRLAAMLSILEHAADRF